MGLDLALLERLHDLLRPIPDGNQVRLLNPLLADQVREHLEQVEHPHGRRLLDLGKGLDGVLAECVHLVGIEHRLGLGEVLDQGLGLAQEALADRQLGIVKAGRNL